MDGEPTPMRIPRDDPVAVALVQAVHGGDLDTGDGGEGWEGDGAGMVRGPVEARGKGECGG